MNNENKKKHSGKMYDFFERYLNAKETVISNDTDKDLLQKYIVNIRNLEKLDTEMINNISKMCNEDIIKVMNAYNEVTHSFSAFITTMK